MQNNQRNIQWGHNIQPDSNTMNATYMQQMMVGQQVNPSNLTPVQLQQWQQWQMQYQAWQDQYGKEYEKSMKAISQIPPQPVQAAPPLPPESVRPPLPVAPVEAPKPPLPSAEPPEELSESEKNFDIEFKQWEKQFQDWKIQNANHPDKAQYSEYEKKWESWREHLLGRREQMKQRRLASKVPQSKVDPAKTVNSLFNNEPLQFKKPSNEMMTEITSDKVETDKSNFNWSNVLAKAEEKGFIFDTAENRNSNTNESKRKEDTLNRFPEIEESKQCEPVFTTPGKGGAQNKPKDRDSKMSKDRPSPNMPLDDMNQHNFTPILTTQFPHMVNNCMPGGFGQKNVGPGPIPNNWGPGFGSNNFGHGFGPNNAGAGFFPNNFGPGFGPNNYPMGHFGPGFNLPGNFNNNFGNNGGNNFNDGPNNCFEGPGDRDGSRNFNEGSRDLNDGPRNYNDNPRNLDDGPRSFNEGSREFNGNHRNSNDGPRNFNDGQRQFNDWPRNFNDGPRNFNDGSRNFNDGPRNFNEGPRNFNEGSRGFNDCPRDFFNNGSRNIDDGPRMFNDGPRNFNDGVRDFNDGSRDFFNSGPRNFNDNQRNFNDNQRDLNEEQRSFKDTEKNSLDGVDGPRSFDCFKGPEGNFDKRSTEKNFPNCKNSDPANKESFGNFRPRESITKDRFNDDFDDRDPGNVQDPLNNSLDDTSNDGAFPRNRFDDRPFDGPDMRSKPPSLMDLQFNSNQPSFSKPSNDRFETNDSNPGPSGSLMKKEWEKYEKDDYYDDPFEEKEEPIKVDKDYRFTQGSGNTRSLLGPGPGAFNMRQNEQPFTRDDMRYVRDGHFNDFPRRNNSHQRYDLLSNNHPDNFSKFSQERRTGELPFPAGDKSENFRLGQNESPNINRMPPLPTQGANNALGKPEETSTNDPSHLSGFVGNILAKLGVSGTDKIAANPTSKQVPLHSNEPPPFLDNTSLPPPAIPVNPEPEWKPQVFDYSNITRRNSPEFKFEIVKDYSHGEVKPQSFDYAHGGGSTLKKFDYGHGSDQPTKNFSYEHKANVFDYSHGKSHSPSLDRFPNKSRSRENSDTSRAHEVINRSPPPGSRGIDREAVKPVGDNIKNVNYDTDLRDGYRGREPDRNRDRRERDLDRNRDLDRHKDRDRDFDRNRDRNREFDRNRDRDLDRFRDRDLDRNRERDADRVRDRDRSPIRKRSRSPRPRSRSPRRPIRREDEPKRSEGTKDVGKDTKTENLAPPLAKADSSLNVISVEDLIHIPGRTSRPQKIVFIMRGIAGSGKSFVTRLIKDKEVELGGSAPRILSIDDYFMVDSEEEVKDVESGQTAKKKVMKYEYDAEMESAYQVALLKAFKKTVSDGFFTFIIVDSANKQTKDLDEMWSFAKQKGFQVYICEMDNDIPACVKRNIHKRSESELELQAKEWEAVPKHYLRLDVRSLLQSEAIDEVEMEDAVDEVISNENLPKDDKDNEKDEDEPEMSYFLKSKWDDFESSVQKLDRLDGLKKKKPTQTTMEAYLYTEDFAQQPEPSATPGKKRVRWADMEERREQEKMRAIGFVVGQTDWKRMMDPSSGESALTRTKYI